MPLRSFTGSCWRTLVSPTRISPEVGSISRLIIFMVVVLPQPEGPTSTTVSPSAISRERSRTAGARAPGKLFETLRIEIIVLATVKPPRGVRRPSITDRSRETERGVTRGNSSTMGPAMFLDVFADNPFATNCWAVAAHGSDEAVLIDPRFQPAPVGRMLERAGKRPVAGRTPHAGPR